MTLLEDLDLDYQFILQHRNNYAQRRAGLWGNRLDSWFIKLSTNGRLDSKKLSRFRKTAALISEVPRNPHIQKPIIGGVYSFLRNEGFKRYCFQNYEKFSSDNTLDWQSFSEVGEPYFFEADGRKFNERFLRHLRTTSLIQSHIPLSAGDWVLDIGGGYGQFSMQLRRLFPKIRNVIIDFPEQLLLARYYMGTINPSLNINTIRSCYDKNSDFKKDLDNFDILLLPAENYEFIKSLNLRLVCNFSSFGEMPKQQFKAYLENKSICKADYFFSVNRMDSFPTYTNGLCVLDYLDNSSKVLHLGVSPVWDYHFTSFSPLFVKKHAFYSRNFELIKKKI